MSDREVRGLINQRAHLVKALIDYAKSRQYHLLPSDFDGFSDEVIEAEAQWVKQGNSSSLVFQIGEQIAQRGR